VGPEALRALSSQLRGQRGAASRELAARLDDAADLAEARSAVTQRERRGARERLYVDAVTLGVAVAVASP
jgi:hypothetical protein